MNEVIQDEDKRKKRIIFALIAIGIVTAVISYYIYSSQKKYEPKKVEPTVNLQGKQDVARESWMLQSSNQLGEQKKRIEDLEKMTTSLTKQLEQAGQQQSKFPAGTPPVPQPPTPGQAATPTGISSTPGTPGMPPALNLPPPTDAQQAAAQQQGKGALPQSMVPPPPAPPATGPGTQQRGPQAPGQYADMGKAQVQQKPMTNLIAIEEGKAGPAAAQPVQQGKQAAQPQKGQKPSEPTGESGSDAYIPAGAFVKVTLLNGIDAPTGSKGKGNPYPVLGRVMNLAIFPNYWKGDIRECFMIGEATGELSSERVHIRFNNLSCMTKKGEIVESQVTSYAVGEDGKIALAGRVTSKQGAILARALAAGFVQGVAQAFNYSYNTVTTTAAGNIMTINPQQAAQAGISQGISQAASELAKFFMELNREMHPVIEINSGRQVEAVFLTKTTLNKTTGKKVGK